MCGDDGVIPIVTIASFSEIKSSALQIVSLNTFVFETEWSAGEIIISAFPLHFF